MPQPPCEIWRVCWCAGVVLAASGCGGIIKKLEVGTVENVLYLLAPRTVRGVPPGAMWSVKISAHQDWGARKLAAKVLEPAETETSHMATTWSSVIRDYDYIRTWEANAHRHHLLPFGAPCKKRDSSLG